MKITIIHGDKETVIDPQQALFQPSIVLSKFKLTKFGAEAEYTEYEQVEGGFRMGTEVTKKFPFQPSEELLEAFTTLTPHLLMLTEFVNEHDVEKTTDVMAMELAEHFKVTGIVVKESGVTLIGRRLLRGKKVLNLTTPFLLWEVPDGVDGYSFAITYQNDVKQVTDLAIDYITGAGQVRQASQMSLGFDVNQEPPV